MLALRKSKDKSKCTPNILPCRIHHDGPVKVTKRYWNPTSKPDEPMTVYFRGKKLYGKQLRVPDGYQGIVAMKTDRVLPVNDHPDPEDEELKPDTRILEELTEFDDIMVWGHEKLPDDLTDPFIAGIDEWIKFSQQIHSYENPEEKFQINSHKLKD